GSVPRCRFDPNLCRYADDDESVDAAISQSEVEPRPFEGRHRQFVEDAFSGTRQQFRRDLKSGSIAQKPWVHLFRRIRPLPRHSHPELKHAHEFSWQRQVTRKEYADTSIASCGEHSENLLRYLNWIRNLTQNSNLHIVNKQGDPLWIAHLFYSLRYAQSVGVFH